MSNNNNLITIEATLVTETDKATLLNCEGNEEWFPKSQCNFNKEKEELTAPKWLLRQRFPNENF